MALPLHPFSDAPEWHCTGRACTRADGRTGLCADGGALDDEHLVTDFGAIETLAGGVRQRRVQVLEEGVALRPEGSATRESTGATQSTTKKKKPSTTSHLASTTAMSESFSPPLSRWSPRSHFPCLRPLFHLALRPSSPNENYARGPGRWQIIGKEQFYRLPSSTCVELAGTEKQRQPTPALTPIFRPPSTPSPPARSCLTRRDLRVSGGAVAHEVK